MHYIEADVREPGPPGDQRTSVWERIPSWSKLKTFRVRKRASRDGRRFREQPAERRSGDRHRLWRLYQEVVRRHQVVCREAVRREVAGQGDRSADRIRQLGLRDLRCGSQKIAGLYSDLAKQTFKPYRRPGREVHPGATDRPRQSSHRASANKKPGRDGRAFLFSGLSRIISPRAASRATCRSCLNASDSLAGRRDQLRNSPVRSRNIAARAMSGPPCRC